MISLSPTEALADLLCTRCPSLPAEAKLLFVVDAAVGPLRVASVARLPFWLVAMVTGVEELDPKVPVIATVPRADWREGGAIGRSGGLPALNSYQVKLQWKHLVKVNG